MIRSTLVRAVAALTAMVLLAACDPGSAGGAGSDDTQNMHDVMFTQMMIPHHRQAVVMSTLAETRARSPQVLELAADIKAAQLPEIAEMKGWLEEWGVNRSGGMGHMDHMRGMGSGSMMGMLSAEQMRQLRRSSGSTFERLYLRGMIGHHQGAIAMADAVIATGQDPDVIALARSIRKSQAEEIVLMRQLLVRR